MVSNLQFSSTWLKICPFCGQGREVLRTELIKEDQTDYYFYFQCPHCLAGLIFLLTAVSGWPQFFGWPTDLTYSELFEQGAVENHPLAADEVLTFHEFFAKNNQVNSLIG